MKKSTTLITAIASTSFAFACGGPEQFDQNADELGTYGSAWEPSFAHAATPESGDGMLFTRTTPASSLTSPDGDPITVSEWLSFSHASASINCATDPSVVTINASGLIPDGVYTIWHFGADGAGQGALGDPSGSDNTLIADAEGNGSLTVREPGCNYGRFVFAYHLDNLTYGSSPGPATLWATHFVIGF